MESKDITVSYVVTVFNKEPYVGTTVRSLLQQEGPQKAEYIFVDDVSTDRSVAVIEEATKGVPGVTVVKNTVNAGPSVRLNQGARLARGKYLQCFDSDDIMAANATSSMLRLMQENDADLLYGRWKQLNAKGPDILGRRVPANATFAVSDTPLEFVLSHSYSHMALMVKREVFLAAGGCNEGVFVQDESLPIRLAAKARRFIIMDAPVTFVPMLDGQLSGNKSQLNHDRFLANYQMLTEQDAQMSETARRLLYRRCISAAWKEMRKTHPHRLLLHYLRSKLQLLPCDMQRLEVLHGWFLNIPGVRRVA